MSNREKAPNLAEILAIADGLDSYQPSTPGIRVKASTLRRAVEVAKSFGSEVDILKGLEVDPEVCARGIAKYALQARLEADRSRRSATGQDLIEMLDEESLGR